MSTRFAQYFSNSSISRAAELLTKFSSLWRPVDHDNALIAIVMAFCIK